MRNSLLNDCSSEEGLSRREFMGIAAAALIGAGGIGSCGCSNGKIGTSGSSAQQSEGGAARPNRSHSFIGSFVVMSDSHVCEDSPRNQEHFDNALRDIATYEPKPVSIVMVGDITDSGTEEDYDLVREICSDAGYDFDRDFVKVMGNHEQYSRDFDSATMRHDEKHVRFMDQAGVDNVYYEKTIDDIHFICLGPDESETGSWVCFNFSDEQIAWLKSKLDEDAAEGRMSYVFCHEPLLNTVRNTGKGSWVETHCLEDNEELASVLEGRSNVVYFSGHTHLYPDIARPDKAGPLYVNDGACGPGQMSPDAFDWETGFVGSFGWLVSVYDDEAVFKARNFLEHEWIDGLEYHCETI